MLWTCSFLEWWGLFMKLGCVYKPAMFVGCCCLQWVVTVVKGLVRGWGVEDVNKVKHGMYRHCWTYCGWVLYWKSFYKLCIILLKLSACWCSCTGDRRRRRRRKSFVLSLPTKMGSASGIVVGVSFVFYLTAFGLALGAMARRSRVSIIALAKYTNTHRYNILTTCYFILAA